MRMRLFAGWALGVACSGSALAHEVALPEVGVTAHYDNAVGTSEAASEGRIQRSLLETRPPQRPGEVLEYVPGLIVTQHSGDGKGNQYFLRGFNLDHGTDLGLFLQGMPINLSSHGHGQGYADLNLLVPELIEHIDYRKGAYRADDGDFSAAGSVRMHYVRRLAAPLAQLTLGEGAYQRVVLAGSTPVRAGDAAAPVVLGALEWHTADGPWTVPQNLRRANAVLSLSDGSARKGWRLDAMAYDARWTATDQIPLRAVQQGSLGRFDSLDDSDGGVSSRHSLSAQWADLDDAGGWTAQAYAVRYRLNLWSNFSYFESDPVNGDQFEQSDDRLILGGGLARQWRHGSEAQPWRSTLGLNVRQDEADVGLYDTVRRTRLSTTRDDQVRITAWSLYAEQAVQWTPWWRTVWGLRGDQQRFSVLSRTDDRNTGMATDALWSPKLSMVFGPWQRTEWFVNLGRGFHSNDARGVTARFDPDGNPVEAVPGLVPGFSRELGVRSEWWPGLQTSVALWRLNMDSELLYVGDAGTTEPSRPSRRQGVEWSNRWTPTDWLVVDADLAWTHARFSDASPDGNHIPGAVERAASLAIAVKHLGPWSGSLQWRILGARPLIEDNSVRSSSSVLTNLRVGYALDRRNRFTVDVFNLFDREVNDIEYWASSQMAGESAPVEGRLIHPAEPRSVRLTWRHQF